MARAMVCNRSLVAALSEGTVALFANRRGYSAAAAVGRAGRRAVEEIKTVKVQETESWVLDPVKGYYRPGNRQVEMDAADLRERLLSHK